MALDDVAQTWCISEMGDTPTDWKIASKEVEAMPKYGDSYDYSKPMKKTAKKAPKKAKKAGKKAAKK